MRKARSLAPEWMTFLGRGAVLGALVCAVTLLPGCGGGGGGGMTGGSNIPVRTVVLQDGWSAGVFEFVLWEGTVSGSGTLDGTVQWTFASNDVDLAVSDTTCTEAAFPFCTFLAEATSTTAKPERVSLTVSAGTYRFWVLNLGPERESGTLEIGLTN